MTRNGGLTFNVEVELNEHGGYTVEVPALQGCVTEGRTLEETFAMLLDVMQGLLEVKAEYGDTIPPEFERLQEEFKVKTQ